MIFYNLQLEVKVKMLKRHTKWKPWLGTFNWSKNGP